MAWFKKTKLSTVKLKPRKSDIPDGLWTKCDDCGEIVYNKQLEENFKVCPKCNFHFKMTVKERLALLIDNGSFIEHDDNLVTINPLDFPEYEEKLKKSKETTGLDEAVVTGEGNLDSKKISIGIMDFGFMGASMGSVYGEKITRAIEFSIENEIPLLLVSCSGGARMQEGMLSLMQMAKTSAALSKLNQAGILYISLLTNPTTAGVTASFGMLGDIIIAEPKALIGFAGPRVIEQTIKQRLPKGFQTAEFLLEHGMLDLIVPRKELKQTISRILSLINL